MTTHIKSKHILYNEKKKLKLRLRKLLAVLMRAPPTLPMSESEAGMMEMRAFTEQVRKMVVLQKCHSKVHVEHEQWGSTLIFFLLFFESHLILAWMLAVLFFWKCSHSYLCVTKFKGTNGLVTQELSPPRRSKQTATWLLMKELTGIVHCMKPQVKICFFVLILMSFVSEMLCSYLLFSLSTVAEVR